MNKVLLTAIVLAASVSSANELVCVNKTELVVPIRVTFTASGANLNANQESCQMQRTSDPTRLAARPGFCRGLGKVVANAEVLSMLMSPEVMASQEGYASFDVGLSDAGTPAHTVVARCYVPR